MLRRWIKCTNILLVENSKLQKVYVINYKNVQILDRLDGSAG